MVGKLKVHFQLPVWLPNPVGLRSVLEVFCFVRELEIGEGPTWRSRWGLEHLHQQEAMERRHETRRPIIMCQLNDQRRLRVNTEVEEGLTASILACRLAGIREGIAAAFIDPLIPIGTCIPPLAAPILGGAEAVGGGGAGLDAPGVSFFGGSVPSGAGGDTISSGLLDEDVRLEMEGEVPSVSCGSGASAEASVGDGAEDDEESEAGESFVESIGPCCSPSEILRVCNDGGEDIVRDESLGRYCEIAGKTNASGQ